jgi:hypothetical protein
MKLNEVPPVIAFALDTLTSDLLFHILLKKVNTWA